MLSGSQLQAIPPHRSPDGGNLTTTGQIYKAQASDRERDKDIMRLQQGLTLIELTVVLAVAAIVAVVAIPGLSHLLAREHLANRANSLLETLDYARATAVRRGQRVIVCGRTKSNDCTDSTGSWPNGWLVFVNTDGVFPPHVDPGDAMLRIHESHGKALGLHSNRRYFEFTPRGTGVNGTLTLCPRREDVSPRTVIVSIVGRVRSASQSSVQNHTQACQT